VNRRFCPYPYPFLPPLTCGTHLVIFNLWSLNYSSPTTGHGVGRALPMAARLPPVVPFSVVAWPHHGADDAPPWGWWCPSWGRLRPSWWSWHGADGGDLLTPPACLILPRRPGPSPPPWEGKSQDESVDEG
jgi:hypothetical protein